MTDLQEIKKTLQNEILIRKQRAKDFDTLFSESSLTAWKIWNGAETNSCDRYHQSRDVVSLVTIDPPNPQDFLSPLPFSHSQCSLNDRILEWSKTSQVTIVKKQKQWVLSKIPKGAVAKESIGAGLGTLLKLYSDHDRIQNLNPSSQATFRAYLNSLMKFLLAPVLQETNCFPHYCPLILPHEASSFLAFLEYEALRDKKPTSLFTLLIVRLLIYTGLRAKQLFALQTPQKNELIYNGRAFSIPESFLKICNHLDFSGYLLPQQYRDYSDPESVLHTMIKRASKQYKKRLEKNSVKSTNPDPNFTPTLLRNILGDLRAFRGHTYARDVPRNNLCELSQKTDQSFETLRKAGLGLLFPECNNKRLKY